MSLPHNYLDGQNTLPVNAGDGDGQEPMSNENYIGATNWCHDDDKKLRNKRRHHEDDDDEPRLKF